MTIDHPLESTFESFVIGALAEGESAAFVAHVSECDACAKKLEGEAQAELGMYEVASAAKGAAEVAAKGDAKVAAKGDAKVAAKGGADAAARMSSTSTTTTTTTTTTGGATEGSVVGLRTWRRNAMVLGSAFALAAAILVVLTRRNHEEALPATMTVSTANAAEPIPLTVCPDGNDQEKCIEDAHRHGRFVSYPPWASTPPLGGNRSGQGPSGSPFPVQM
jgi:hypothetical protein